MNNGLQNKGPMQALKGLALTKKSTAERILWLEQARIAAIVGACKGSLASVKSGVRCYVAFVKATVPDAGLFFPPKLEWIQAWAAL